MDWAKQTEDVVKSWTETQKTMWDSWLKTVQQSGDPFQVTEIWNKTMETWEQTVTNTLDAQSQWMKSWAAGYEANKGDVPEEMSQWVEQAQKMTAQWSEIQHQLWQNWFDLVKSIDPEKFAEAFDEEGKKALELWQANIKKAMDAQEEWSKAWTVEQSKKKA